MKREYIECPLGGRNWAWLSVMPVLEWTRCCGCGEDVRFERVWTWYFAFSRYRCCRQCASDKMEASRIIADTKARPDA